jgi:hypothetical protein
MSLKTITCIEPACDDCGSECWDDSDYGTPHFKTTEDALDDLVKHYEWTITDDTQLCRHCTTKRLCEAEGHEWGEWRESHDGVFAGTRHKFCAREGCHEYVQEPLSGPVPSTPEEG